ELALQRLALGDVAAVPHQPTDVRVVDQVLADGLDRARPAVLGPQPQLDRAHEAGAFGEQGDRGGDVRALGRLDVHEQRQLEEVLRSVPDQRLDRGTDVGDDAALVGDDG